MANTTPTPLTDADLTRIYNEANGVTDKQPPISTERIFKAMRAVHERSIPNKPS